MFVAGETNLYGEQISPISQNQIFQTSILFLSWYDIHKNSQMQHIY